MTELPHQTVMVAAMFLGTTQKILEQLENRAIPWRQPWKTAAPVNMVSDKPYRGINVFLLAAQGYGSRYWLTFNQCAKLGGRVNKGEKGALIVFWKRNEYSKVTQKLGLTGSAERMPASQPKYFSTLFHELVHSTGHLSRLSRFEPGEPLARFGSESYSKEELIAEFGASFLCGTAGIDQTMQNSAAYIQHWSKRLREDSKLLVSAASQAQKAADFILGSSETETEE